MVLIEQVKEAGWDVAKFQAYDTNKIKKPGDTNYNELKEAELGYLQLQALKEKCDEVGVEFLASAFDIERVKWLEKLGVKRHKLASRSIYDIGLINAMEKTGKPIIASLAEWLDDFPPTWKATFLYCKSRRQILQNGFDKEDMSKWITIKGTGFSDHTIGNCAAITAAGLGAPIIEKHITLNKNKRGWDQSSSADFNDMKEIANAVRRFGRNI